MQDLSNMSLRQVLYDESENLHLNRGTSKGHSNQHKEIYFMFPRSKASVIIAFVQTLLKASVKGLKCVEIVENYVKLSKGVISTQYC